MSVKAYSVPDGFFVHWDAIVCTKSPLFVDCRFRSRERTTQIIKCIVCQMLTSLRVTIIRSEGIWSAGNTWLSVLFSSG